jgi:hypothetical protein
MHVSLPPRAMVVHLQRVTIAREPPALHQCKNGHPQITRV